jgi:flagellar basal body-associated protein FliL
MADAEKDKKPAAPEGDAAAKKPPIKVIGVVAVLMLAEAAGVYFFVGMTGGHAATANAEIKGADEKEAQEAVEIELVDDKFQNLQTGHVWVWDIAIALKVKKKHEAYVEEQLENRAAEIKEGVGQIIRRAQHSYLREPDLTTINRQITAFLAKVLEPDPADGSSRIERVLIPKCKGMQID